MKTVPVLLLLALLAAGEALASEPGDRHYGVELHAGMGGYSGQTGERTSLGPAYGVLGAYNPLPVLSYEVAYRGLSNPIDESGRKLTSNKVTAGLKAGPHFGERAAWRPFAFVGIGLDYVVADRNPQDLDDALLPVIPLGVGAELFTEAPFRLGVRATYDLTPGALGSGEVAPGDPHPDEWSASLSAQAAF